MVITVSVASYHYIFEFVRNREPSFGFSRKGPWNAPPPSSPPPHRWQDSEPQRCFQGSWQSLGSPCHGDSAGGTGHPRCAQVPWGSRGVPTEAVPLPLSTAPAWLARRVAMWWEEFRTGELILPGPDPIRSARTRTRRRPLRREEFVSEGLGDPARSPPSAGLVGTRTSPKRHRPCFLMFWGQRGRKSNNCLRVKTMDLLCEIFIFRADPGPVGWDLSARVSG